MPCLISSTGNVLLITPNDKRIRSASTLLGAQCCSWLCETVPRRLTSPRPWLSLISDVKKAFFLVCWMITVFHCYAPLVPLNHRPNDLPRTWHCAPALFSTTDRWDFTGEKTGILQEALMILHGGPDDPLGDSAGDLTSTRVWPRLQSQLSSAAAQRGRWQSGNWQVTTVLCQNVNSYEFLCIVGFFRECTRVLILMTVSRFNLLQDSVWRSKSGWGSSSKTACSKLMKGSIISLIPWCVFCWDFKI